jgi:hypothetical protein
MKADASERVPKELVTHRCLLSRARGHSRELYTAVSESAKVESLSTIPFELVNGDDLHDIRQQAVRGDGRGRARLGWDKAR